MNPREEMDVLIEIAASAFRERDPSTGGIRPSATFFDLAPAERDELFSRQMASRVLERTLDAGGLSTTARAVLARASLLDQAPG